MKVGFLFNHDALHQVSHTAPVIAALLDFPNVEVSVLTSSPAQEARVRAIIGDAAARAQFVPLSIGWAARILDAGLRRVAPFRRIAMLRENLAAFAALDVLVVPETTSLLLRDRFGLKDLKFVWIPHGAGDRSVGFREVSRGFDLVLLSGAKVRDRMLAAGLVTPENHAITGYPKFDTIADAPPPRLFANDRPTVLYNAHFEPAYSSWYTMGAAVLDWFARQDRFNLIVAPHVMLFERRLHASVEHRRVRWRRDLATSYRDVSHILIDIGSERSIDMTYTRAADIYLGDVSSQIYEWIRAPRPAIFLNPAHVAWAGSPDFAYWQLGEVIDEVADLPGALDRAVADPDRFRPAQEAAFANTFDVGEDSAVHRAAAAIVEKIRRDSPGVQVGPLGRAAMKRLKLSALPLFAALAVSLPAAAQPVECKGTPGAGAARLSVDATGLHNANGEVAFTLYGSDPDKFLAKRGKFAISRVRATAPVTRACFWVPPGQYALALYHDENGDHKFNRTLWIPKEGFGFSNDAPTTFSLPSFDKVRFAVPAGGRTMRIAIRYKR